jgi:peptidoglycan L-alanyl-D-glutamate endopeptidase CwlK
MLTCTARTVREQIALYAQGREKLDQVNALRKIAGLSPITFQENSRKVTWTLASKHIIDLEDNIPENDKSRAFDIAILRDDRPTWNLKVNVNKNDIPDYDEAGRIGEAVGLRWGGRFPSPDRPHFEV